MTWRTDTTMLGAQRVLLLVDDRFERQDCSVTPRRWWFAIWTQLPPGGAFWDPEETQSLEGLEDALRAEWRRSSKGEACAYVARVATPGVLEYYLYAASTVNLADALTRVRARFPGYRVEMETKADPQWSAYRELLHALRLKEQ